MSGLNATCQAIDPNDKALSNAYATLNDKFTADSETPCPCCGQMALETAYQPPIIQKAGRTGYTLMHCKNPDCAGYGLTLERTAFLQQMKASNPDE
jgi:hypothetical protein